MMEFGNRKLFPGVSSGAHLRPTAHPEPVIDSPTNSAQEDTRTVLKRTPERYKRHHDTHNAIILRRDLCIIKNSIISNVCHIQHLQSQNKTRQESNIRRAVCQLSQGGTQRVRRVVVETLEL